MKQTQRESEKEQFNTRIPKDMKRAIRIMSAALDMSTEELTVVLFSASMGSRDPRVIAKQASIQRKAEEMSLSFNDTDLHPGSLLAA